MTNEEYQKQHYDIKWQMSRLQEAEIEQYWRYQLAQERPNKTEVHTRADVKEAKKHYPIQTNTSSLVRRKKYY